MEWINLYHNPTHSETPRFAHFQTSLRTIRIQYSNLYLSTVKFIKVLKSVNLFTSSYLSWLQVKIQIVISVTLLSLLQQIYRKNMFSMNAVLLVVHVVSSKRFLNIFRDSACLAF